MKRFLFYGLIMSCLFVSSCSEDDMDVTVQFRMRYGDQPLIIGNTYSYPDGKAIQFTRVSFFISDVKAYDDAKEYDLSEVEMVNLTHSHLTAADAHEGYIVSMGSVPTNQIRGIHFALGLNENENSTVPSEYPANHPLSNSGEYWIAWNSYIFVKIEGFVDLDDDKELETSVALHLGSNEAYRMVNVEQISENGNISIDLDVRKLFEINAIYNIEETPHIHSLTQLAQTHFLMDNLQKVLENTN